MLVGKKKLNFPRFDKYSRTNPGVERIHESVLAAENDAIERCSNAGDVQTIHELLVRAASLNGNGEFIGEQTVRREYSWTTYNQVLDLAKNIGSALLHLGLGSGRVCRIGIAGLNSLKYIAIQQALASYSMVIVPLYHNYSTQTLCQIIENCNLEVIFCDRTSRANEFIAFVTMGQLKALKTIIVFDDPSQEIRDKLTTQKEIAIYDWDSVQKLGREYPKPFRPPSPSDIYIICHTSGTTGSPKGVELSHRAILAGMFGLYAQWCQPPHNMHFGRNDVYLSFLSLAHIYEQLLEAFIIYVLGRIGIYSGDMKNLTDDARILRPTILALVPRLLNRYRDVILAHVSTQHFLKRLLFRIALKQKLKTLANGRLEFDTFWDKFVFKEVRALFGGRLRLLTSGGAPIAIEVMNFSRVVYGCLLCEGYGQTECSAAGTISLLYDTQGGHVGGPAIWAQVKLVDVDELSYKAEDDIGEVCFRGAGLMTGYFNDPQLTASVIDSQGWLHTGDIGTWLPNGSLRIIGRKNNVFKLAQADFVSLEHIEGVYGQYPLLKQIFVYGSALREFLVAIAVVDIQKVRNDFCLASSKHASWQNLPKQSDDELLMMSEVRAHLLDKLRVFGKQKGLSSIEQIKTIHLTTEEFTVEGGMLTPTLKMIRPRIIDKYAAIIEQLYDPRMCT